MTHRPSCFSHSRPIAMPGCLRQKIRSGWCRDIVCVGRHRLRASTETRVESDCAVAQAPMNVSRALTRRVARAPARQMSGFGHVDPQKEMVIAGTRTCSLTQYLFSFFFFFFVFSFFFFLVFSFSARFAFFFCFWWRCACIALRSGSRAPARALEEHFQGGGGGRRRFCAVPARCHARAQRSAEHAVRGAARESGRAMSGRRVRWLTLCAMCRKSRFRGATATRRSLSSSRASTATTETHCLFPPRKRCP